MSSNQLPPEIQKKFVEYQQYQNQLRSIRVQLDSSTRHSSESKQTLKEIQNLDPSKNPEIYKMSGNVLFGSDLGTVKTDLEDSLEYLEIQIQKLNKKETELANKMKALEKELSAFIK